jgi:hypothetical protein
MQCYAANVNKPAGAGETGCDIKGRSSLHKQVGVTHYMKEAYRMKNTPELDKLALSKSVKEAE